MRIDWKHLAYALAALPVAGLMFAWIGFFNIGASSGHWKITEWVLHSLMRSAVKTYAYVEVDPLAELPQHAVAQAAGHFARGCSFCHGAPGEEPSAAAGHLLPKPPDLVWKVGEWNDAQLFWIVKHGVRFTGMPAWPTQVRDDEVWGMVAFLRELPDLDVSGYRELAYGGRSAMTMRPHGFEQTLAECARCHGDDGMDGGEGTPAIAGQSEAYLRESLRAFAKEHRHSGVMALPMQAIDPAEIDALSRHFAALPSPLRALGRNATRPNSISGVVMNGVPTRGIPACIGCHGDDAPRNPAYPRIAGQKGEYVESQLRLFRSGQRGGTLYAHLMENAARGLTDEEISALADFLSESAP
jgi:cytochrome c553